MASRARTPWYERVFWSLHSRSYDDFGGIDSPRVRKILATIERLHTKRHLDVLDLGAGTGNYAIPLALAGHEVVAMDVAPGMLEWLRAKSEAAGVAIRTRRVDLHRGIPCEKDSFDVVLCVYVLQVIRNPAQLLVETRRVLGDRGHLVLVTEDPTAAQTRAVPRNAPMAHQIVWRAKHAATRMTNRVQTRPRGQLLDLAVHAGYDLVQEVPDEHRVVLVLRPHQVVTT